MCTAFGQYFVMDEPPICPLEIKCEGYTLKGIKKEGYHFYRIIRSLVFPLDQAVTIAPIVQPFKNIKIKKGILLSSVMDIFFLLNLDESCNKLCLRGYAGVKGYNRHKGVSLPGEKRHARV